MLSLNWPDGALSELQYADDLVLMSETIKGLRKKFKKWKDAFEINCLNGNFDKTNVMVNGGISKDGMSKSKADLFRVGSLREKANSVLCLQCGS